jgi:uncharacterized FlaG/YvyC family protein
MSKRPGEAVPEGALTDYRVNQENMELKYVRKSPDEKEAEATARRKQTEIRQQEDQAELANVREQLSEYGEDDKHAERYWGAFALKHKEGGASGYANPEKIDGHKRGMLDLIRQSAERGSFGLNLSGNGPLNWDDKAKLSAYRVLARKNGYKIGQFKINGATATAEISVMQNNSENEQRVEDPIQPAGEYLNRQVEAVKKNAGKSLRPGQ